MSKESEEFFRVMQEFLPSTKIKYRDSIEAYGLLLVNVVIEDTFMPDIFKFICDSKDINLLEDIFNYFEVVFSCKDEHLINIFSITVLEILGNHKQILKSSQKYMGPKTKFLQIEADRSLGRG